MKGAIILLLCAVALARAFEDSAARCATGEYEGALLAHEYCDHFYKCTNARIVEIRCASGTFFDPSYQWCYWSQWVDCGNRIIPDPQDVVSSESEEDNNNVIHDDPSQAPVICAKIDANGVLVAHEKCDKYYICDGGVPAERPCNEGLLYNPNSQRCDWPSNVVCGDRIIPSY